jgi:hypothetical protein
VVLPLRQQPFGPPVLVGQRLLAARPVGLGKETREGRKSKKDDLSDEATAILLDRVNKP